MQRQNKPGSIGYCDYTSNPLYVTHRDTGKRGWACARVSEGCRNCYSAALNMGRFGTGLDFTVPNEDKVGWHLRESEFAAWRRLKPVPVDPIFRPGVTRKPRVFVCDMTDLFWERIPPQMVWTCIAEIDDAPGVTFQVLTKRPQNYQRVFWPEEVPENLHLGISAENQETLSKRWRWLRKTDVSVRWISYEPMLGPITVPEGCGWLIAGGESGPNRREMRLEWLEDVVAQCDALGIPVYVKQDSSLHPGQQGRIPDGLWARKEWPR